MSVDHGRVFVLAAALLATVSSLAFGQPPGPSLKRAATLSPRQCIYPLRFDPAAYDVQSFATMRDGRPAILAVKRDQPEMLFGEFLGDRQIHVGMLNNLDCLRVSAVADIRGVAHEIQVNGSLVELKPPIEGISMVLKAWVEESNANSHFVLSLFTRPQFPQSLNSYYEVVPVFTNGHRVALKEQSGPDCSITQTAIFSYGSVNGKKLGIVTASRVERSDAAIPTQTEPRPQRLMLFTLHQNIDHTPEKPLLWFQSVSEHETDAAMCDAAAVRAAMMKFAEQR